MRLPGQREAGRAPVFSDINKEGTQKAGRGGVEKPGAARSAPGESGDIRPQRRARSFQTGNRRRRKQN